MVLAALLTLTALCYVLHQSLYGWDEKRRAQNLAEKIALNVHRQCRTTQDEISRAQEGRLHRIEEILKRAGALTLDDTSSEQWHLTDPRDGIETTLFLPRLLAGNEWLGKSAPGPLIDRIRTSCGGQIAVYQRINETGDLLRICSTTPQAARGALLPAKIGQGQTAPLIDQLLRGETVHRPGRSEGAWVLVSLVPLRHSESGEVVGALEIRTKSRPLEKLARRIMGLRAGHDGYVFVLGAHGEQRGRYIISRDGLRDGEDIWNSLDTAGRPFIQAIVLRSLALPQRAEKDDPAVVFERYPWQNPGERHPRHKKVAITYFEPWDWVIGAGYYEDEF